MTAVETLDGFDHYSSISEKAQLSELKVTKRQIGSFFVVVVVELNA